MGSGGIAAYTLAHVKVELVPDLLFPPRAPEEHRPQRLKSGGHRTLRLVRFRLEGSGCGLGYFLIRPVRLRLPLPPAPRA
jgi:hypothetical protein